MESKKPTFEYTSKDDYVLLESQKLDIIKVCSKLNETGNYILESPVGLEKSIVVLEVIRYYLSIGKKVLFSTATPFNTKIQNELVKFTIMLPED